jgi:hypothetical protein
MGQAHAHRIAGQEPERSDPQQAEDRAGPLLLALLGLLVMARRWLAGGSASAVSRGLSSPGDMGRS